MGIRTGRQYLDKLNSMRPHIVIDGVTVTANIAEHPAFRNVARTYAQLYDMQFKLAYDASISGFSGRQALYEYFFFGDPVRMAGAMVSGYDREPARRRIRELLARSDTKSDTI